MNDIQQDSIKKIIDLKVPVARVWRALTDHEEFGEWFRVRLDGPFEVGKSTTGNMTYPGHEHVQWISLTEKMEHEKCFAFSWPPESVDPDTHYDENAKVLVTFLLEPIATGTRLTIVESGFLQFPDSKRLDILRSNTEGWDIQAENIAAHVTSG